ASAAAPHVLSAQPLASVAALGYLADPAEHPRPRTFPTRRSSDLNVGAVELQRVGAGLALDHIAPVTRIPHERVVAGAELRHVVAATTDHGVVAVAANQHVGTGAASDGVVAGTAIDRQQHVSGRKAGGVDHVVAS